MAKKNKNAVFLESEKTELQMTSMIDVVFLLLIFFIATMQWKRPEGLLRAFLPKKASAAQVSKPGKPQEEDLEDLQDINIRIEAEGRSPKITVGQAILPSFRQLAVKLMRLKRQFPDHRIVLDGDPNVYYGFVVKALNACIEAGYTRISFAAPKSE